MEAGNLGSQGELSYPKVIRNTYLGSNPLQRGPYVYYIAYNISCYVFYG